ncbi:hypothetical protein FJ364_03070 [Candidatus Dependentiae bacterium]|nr:hypothetical protein [Candidatus Dependentiae bacterium]
MNYRLLLLLLISNYSFIQAQNIQSQTTLPPLAIYRASWMVIGAGPAGISAVAALRDANVKPENIIWIDETFNVGALGQYYYNVTANSSRATFLHLFNLSPHFKRYIRYARDLQTHQYVDCTIQDVVAPLAQISNHFRRDVANIQGYVEKLAYNNQTKVWVTELPAIRIEARNVILATGSHPKKLVHDAPTAKQISLEVALDIKKLQRILPLDSKGKNIVVFGSSHSAAHVLKNLIDLDQKNIIHVYKQPFRFKHKTRQGARFPFSGLKGPIAAWTKEHLVENEHPAVTQISLDSTLLTRALQNSWAIIDAVGFEANKIPVEAKDLYPMPKNTHELGPHLYGIGIAFPRETQDASGHKELAIGVLDFMKTIKEHLPHWLKAA